MCVCMIFKTNKFTINLVVNYKVNYPELILNKNDQLKLFLSAVFKQSHSKQRHKGWEWQATYTGNHPHARKVFSLSFLS